MRERVGLVPGDLLGQEPLRAGERRRAAAAPRCSRRSRAATPPRSRSPNSSRKNRLPCTNCRAIASPPGMLVSDSTHMPPTGTNWPAATCSCTRANTSGRCSLSQAHCWACDIAKTNVGIVVHQRGDVGDGPGHLADRLAQRPQPGRVDVGVADRRDPVGARRGPGAASTAASSLAGGRRGAGDVVQVEDVERPLDGAQDLPAARLVQAAARASAGRAPRGPGRAPRPPGRRRPGRPVRSGRAARSRPSPDRRGT